MALEFLPGHLAWNILSFVYASVFVAFSSDRLNVLRRDKRSRTAAARMALGVGAMTTVLIVNETFPGAPWPYVTQLARVPVASAQALLCADIRPRGERCTCPTR